MRGPIKRQTLRILRNRNIPVATVLDVGVLSGTPELMAAYPDRPHILFEPVAEFAAAIEQNYRNIPHQLVQAAVSDRSGDGFLKTSSIISGMDISHSHVVDAAEESSRTVRMVTLDDCLRNSRVGKPYLLKIDVDGHEMSVLKGATETLKETSIVIIEATGHALAERLGFLQNAGFTLFDLTEPCYYDNSFWQCDVVLVHRDLHAQHFARINDAFEESKYSVFDPSPASPPDQ